MGSAPPAGYVRVAAGRCSVVTLAEHEADARALLAEGTLYEAAARDLAARSFQGRVIAYAIALPVSGLRVVVRHSHRGGLLAALRRDYFFPPTRAPRELRAALRLERMGIRTPRVIMYGVERRFGILRRSDVVTQEVRDSHEFVSFLSSDIGPATRAEAWRAVRELVTTLGDAGARHHDLNVKNLLLARGRSGALEAWLLDVDRVSFGGQRSLAVRRGNVKRLARSVRKWRDERGALVDDAELDALERLAP